jgi:putative phosphonate metabolism protein
VSRPYAASMASTARYAIYYAPAPGSELDRFGARLLGYDAYRGEQVRFPAGIDRITPDWHELTRDPRKYGFHGTLKAPLSLADGSTEAELLAACQAFADTPRSIPLVAPVIDSISGFLAILPAAPSAELAQLAADCVSQFDSFRAPLTAADRERRNPSQLTPRERDHLDRWGYPYVMEDFRFHLTLTGRLPASRREPVLSMLRSRFSEIGLTALAIDRIALFRQQDADSRFRIIEHWKLRG